MEEQNRTRKECLRLVVLYNGNEDVANFRAYMQILMIIHIHQCKRSIRLDQATELLDLPWLQQAMD